MNEWKSIVESFKSILSEMDTHFSEAGVSERIDSLKGLVNAGEYTIALEDLCSNIYEFDMPLSARVYDLINRLIVATDTHISFLHEIRPTSEP